MGCKFQPFIASVELSALLETDLCQQKAAAVDSGPARARLAFLPWAGDLLRRGLNEMGKT